MVFNYDDSVDKNLYLLKGHGPAKLKSEFPDTNWKRRGLDDLLRETGTFERKKGSG